MLWRPATVGEEVFLTIYDRIGQDIQVTSPTSHTLDFLISGADFTEFARLTAATEVFLRIVRTGKAFYEQYSELPGKDFGKQVLREEDLLDYVRADEGLPMLIKQTAEISYRRKDCSPSLEKATLASLSNCYMCGRQFIDGDEFAAASVEHLWPLSMGGESIEENVIPGCTKCNNNRDKAPTWAWGPVQNTYYHPSDDDPPNDLRISLGLARLMAKASAAKPTRRPLTLKDAALKASPLFPSVSFTSNHHHLYFEIMRRAEVTA